MKKKFFYCIVSLTLAMTIILTACTSPIVDEENQDDNVHIDNNLDDEIKKLDKFEVKNIKVPYEPRDVIAQVKPYSVKADLSNIENMSLFENLSKEQIDLLIKNNFVVNPSKEEQLFYIYENNEYVDIPSFITTDSVLQVYHIFYDYTLRTLENDKLLGLLEELTENMLRNSIEIYNKLEDKEMKEIQEKNIAFFATAQLALDNELIEGIPEEAGRIALEELELINNHLGFNQSSLFSPYDLDYSQYTVRGHYTRSDDLARYFKAMMWYGQGPFPLYKENVDRNTQQTLQALLITYSIYSDKESYDAWEMIYEPTNFFVGNSDDLNIYQYGDLLLKIYGDKPDLNKLNDKDKLDEFYKEADKLPEPKIKADYTEVNYPSGKQFRFMGQRYVLDADIIQQLVVPLVRPIPSGLDVMGVLGSERAKDIQLSKAENQLWEKYPSELERLSNEFSKLEEEQWMKNMYQGWLWTLKGYLEAFGEGYPSFMTNEAWIDKDLNTALGSWAELKHDTILYGKQSGAEMGGGDYKELLGYVEPNIEVYEKLLWLTKFSRENLKARDMEIQSIDVKMEEFEGLLEFLINCSLKQLRNEELTRDEYERIMYYGGVLEGLTSSFAGDGIRWFEITSDTDKNMAVIADFHTIGPNSFHPGGYMEAGVGPAYEIYVVVPIGGKLYLTKGAVFSYHEFASDVRLTDETWQEMIKEDKQPNMPEWTNSFIAE